MLFLQIADGVDDRTWEHHLGAGDYSKWFRHQIKNVELAREAAEVERDLDLDLPRAAAASAKRSPHDTRVQPPPNRARVVFAEVGRSGNCGWPR
jgi:hypothetical protein